MNINTLHKKLVKRAGSVAATAGKATADAAKAGLAQKLMALLGKGKDKAVTFGKDRWQGVKNDWNDMLHAVTDEGKIDWGRRAIGASKLTGKALLPSAAVAGSYELLKDPASTATKLKEYINEHEIEPNKKEYAREVERFNKDLDSYKERFNKDLERYKDLYEKFKKYDKKLTLF